ncbi:MAG: A24 family peptidase [Pseudomonadota bacterium]
MFALKLVVLCVLLACAIWSDVRERRIPNRLVAGGACAGLALSLLPGQDGLAQAGAGLLLGFAFLLPFYLLGTMGAGDVKLMAAVGTFLGVTGTIGATLLTLLAGGVLAILVAWRTGSLPAALRNVRNFAMDCALWIGHGPSLGKPQLISSASRLPYSVAIAAGVVSYLAAQFYYTSMGN